MPRYRIATIAGDGIGKEVMPEGVRVLDAAARKFGIELELDHFHCHARRPRYSCTCDPVWLSAKSTRSG